jgi:hypothetical protein
MDAATDAANGAASTRVFGVFLLRIERKWHGVGGVTDRFVKITVSSCAFGVTFRFIFCNSRLFYRLYL